jgi:hypothetical protein
LYTGHLDKWNGTTWISVPTSSGFGWGDAMIVHDDGSGSKLYVGGKEAGGGQVVRWDGIAWTGIGGPGEITSSFALYDDGTGVALYAGARDYNNGPMKWDGANWSLVGGGLAAMPGSAGGNINQYSLMPFDDGGGPALYAGGTFLSADGNRVDNIAKWDGAHWSAVGAGCNGDVFSLCPFDDGGGPALYVGGSFSTVGSAPANRIASWGSAGGCVPTGTAFCEPGINGVLACPCSNPPAGPGRGCDNSSDTGGASLAASGFARLGTDSLVFTTNGERQVAPSIVLQGTTSNGTGLVFGQGVRCVAGSLKRLYVKAPSAGSITAPGANDPSVSARSAALGSPIAPGMHRYYGVYYRDPIILGGCPASSGFNITQQLDVLWHP